LLPGGDLDRAENQRNVIKAIVEKGLSAQVMTRWCRHMWTTSSKAGFS
jgi:anionic cell wall polymer biosynthesis LytR-Cps2A-Psr (LCP) family protein